MNGDPCDRPGRTRRMKKQLVLRPGIAVRVLVIHGHEDDWTTVDRDLEGLQFAVSQIVLSQRNEPVDKRVWVPSFICHRRAADILDKPHVAQVIRVNAFVTATAKAAIERAQTGAASSIRIKICAHLDDTAGRSGFLGKEEGVSKRIPSRTIDTIEIGQTGGVDWSQKRSAMVGAGHIEVDTRDVSEIAAVLVSLKKKMAAIIV